MLAEVLRLNVFQNLHAMAACQSGIECVCCKAAGAKTVCTILAVLFFIGSFSGQRLSIELELLLLPVRKEVVCRTVVPGSFLVLHFAEHLLVLLLLLVVGHRFFIHRGVLVLIERFDVGVILLVVDLALRDSITASLLVSTGITETVSSVHKRALLLVMLVVVAFFLSIVFVVVVLLAFALAFFANLDLFFCLHDLLACLLLLFIARLPVQLIFTACAAVVLICVARAALGAIVVLGIDLFDALVLVHRG